MIFVFLFLTYSACMTDCRSTHISMNDPISFHDTCALIFIAALFTIARTWNQEAHQQMNKKVVVHIYYGILLSYKKECILVSSNEVDKPRAYCTEWSKSEREKQISCINTYIWNLERWYWWTCLQSSSGDTDIENRLVDTVRGGEIGTNWESSMKTYTLPYVK